MTDKQPEALRLANALQSGGTWESQSQRMYEWDWDDPCDDAAAELRRLHTVNAQLLEALEQLTHSLEPDYFEHDDQRQAFIKAIAAIAAAKERA